MWINGKYMTEPEIQAYIKAEQEKAYRDGYMNGMDALSR